MTKQEELAIHDLFTREIRPIRDWCEWLERWQVAETLEEMMGLLHAGFGVLCEYHKRDEKKYDEIDRLLFYFSIADGWDDNYLLRVEEDEGKRYNIGYSNLGNTIYKAPHELRQQIARKAFDMICLNFFGVGLYTERDKFANAWEETITSERLFPVIQNFFRAEKLTFSSRIRIRNISRREERSHNEKQAVNFLLNLAKFLWIWQEQEVPSYYKHKDELEKQIKDRRVRIDGAKPWMIEVLAELGELSLLRSWMLGLDRDCLGKLKEIAFRSELGFQHPVKENRKVKTLDEACYVGSVAAWFLKEYKLKKEEHERLDSILKEERRIQESSRKIKELASN